MGLSPFVQEQDKDVQNVLSHFKQEVSSLRTGKATPALVEHVLVEVYGVKTPLQQLASISIPDPRTLIIEPWDKNILKEIEKGVVASDIGVSPVVDGERVRLTLPAMTEETRTKLVKIVHQKLEDARVSLRHVRDRLRTTIQKQESAKDITQDDKFRLQREVDEYMQKQQQELEKIAQQKEKEVMTV